MFAHLREKTFSPLTSSLVGRDEDFLNGVRGEKLLGGGRGVARDERPVGGDALRGVLRPEAVRPVDLLQSDLGMHVKAFADDLEAVLDLAPVSLDEHGLELILLLAAGASLLLTAVVSVVPLLLLLLSGVVVRLLFDYHVAPGGLLERLHQRATHTDQLA